MRVPELEDYQDLLSSIDDSDSDEPSDVLKTQIRLSALEVVLKDWLSCKEVTV